MRIRKLGINVSLNESNGINPIKIERLGSVVALVGRNGSGKSRILKLLEKVYFPQIELSDFLDGRITHMPMDFMNLVNSIPNGNKVLSLLVEFEKAQIKYNKNSSNQDIRKEYQKVKKEYSDFFSSQEQARKRDGYNLILKALKESITKEFPKYFRRIDYAEIHQLQSAFDTKTEKLITFETLVDSVTEIDNYSEFGSIHKTALTYLSKLPHQLVDDRDDCYGDEQEFQKRVSYKRFSSLKKIMQTFLNKELEWEKQTVSRTLGVEGVTRESKGFWKLGGRQFNYAEFSDGEKTLFAYGLLFFLLEQNPTIRIRESIIVIDEPELHLHPESELAVVNGIRKIISDKGQLWIATHSISILSSLSYDEIFMVKGNSIISPSKSTPGNSFVELMGLDEHIEQLSHFVVNISNWAFLNFMTQCFVEPDVIDEASAQDPEVILFKKSLKEKGTGVVLLDFGAGKGRMFKEFDPSEIKNQEIEYHVLEPDEKNVEELELLKPHKIYKKYDELPIEKFDHVLLCNVLHEIPITEWEVILNRISKSIKNDGYIVIIEDLRLPKGEKIDEHGFVIMDVQSVQQLFSLADLPGQLFSSDERYKDRIMCALVRKSQIEKIDGFTISSALDVLQKNVLQNIRELRKLKPNSDNKLSFGRLSAFYSQLYLNVLLAKEKLKEMEQLSAALN